MDINNGVFLDLNIVAAGVVIWVVTLSVALGLYAVYRRAHSPAAGDSPRIQRIDAEPRSATTLPPIPAPVPTVETTERTEPSPVVALAIEPTAAPEANDQPSPYALSDERQTPDAFSVLIVDDNAINRQVLELILDSVNIQHASVENGLEAVQAMANCAYDAVLMDLQMPVMDGFEATRHIREMEQQADSPASTIIVVSANCLDEHVVAGREAGADAHLAKPISAGALIGELSACPAVNRIAA